MRIMLAMCGLGLVTALAVVAVAALGLFALGAAAATLRGIPGGAIAAFGVALVVAVLAERRS